MNMAGGAAVVAARFLTGKFLAGSIANKNAIPYAPRPPCVTGGLRLGTPTITGQGMGAAEMARVAAPVMRAFPSPEVDD